MADIPLTMPKMSMTMEEGTLTEWHVAEGDVIAKGDVVAVVMTDKVDMEVESPAAGTVTSLLCAEGDVVPVGGNIAIVASEEDDLLGDLFSGDGGDAGADASGGIDTAADPGASAAPDSPPGPSGSEEVAGGAADGAPPAAAPDGPMPPSVPLARKLARDHGLDLRTITPTGPHGTVRVKDVKEAITASGAQRQDPAAAAPAAGTPAPASGASAAGAAPAAPVVEAAPEELLGTARERRTRQLTAQAMAATPLIPQFTAFRRMDLSVAARARTGVLKGVSWTTLLLRAYAMLLRGNEQLNGSWAGTGVRRNPTVDIVLAVDTPGGLLVPVLREPDQLGVRELDAQVRALGASAKEGKVDPSLFGPATGTLSNLGGLGVDRFNALITPPQATALSVGTVGVAPVVEADGTLGARMTCELGLSIDHRVADGADAARALQTIQDLLDDPLRLAL
ncbi:dihydrolipoamide acetyltransferase family protein [Brachybacterium phenoliresistens]|uniref:dihydrolipoamide acetyltransferase family protein n=1 Tax=Brachybacterium phenoliresistens TaxID=396014 RepID=UPI0031D6A36A